MADGEDSPTSCWSIAERATCELQHKGMVCKWEPDRAECQDCDALCEFQSGGDPTSFFLILGAALLAIILCSAGLGYYKYARRQGRDRFRQSCDQQATGSHDPPFIAPSAQSAPPPQQELAPQHPSKPPVPSMPAAPAGIARQARPKRWGDGLEAPAAGARIFVKQGFVVAHDVQGAIARCGLSSAHVAEIMKSGRLKASTATTPISRDHAAALYAYTEDTPLYRTLNYTMRTPHTQSTPTDTQLEQFTDYICHMEKALGSVPTHVSEVHGPVYRGITTLLNPSIYAAGKLFTWQAFSSSTKKQTATLDFVNHLPGRKLEGSIFIIYSTTAKDIRHFSAFPSEEEVLFPPNSQFLVETVLTIESKKKDQLDELTAYDLTELDVYVLKQLA